jgi:hypothetical protein
MTVSWLTSAYLWTPVQVGSAQLPSPSGLFYACNRPFPCRARTPFYRF